MQSKPGPKFAVVAGTLTVMSENTAIEINSKFQYKLLHLTKTLSKRKAHSLFSGGYTALTVLSMFFDTCVSPTDDEIFIARLIVRHRLGD